MKKVVFSMALLLAALLAACGNVAPTVSTTSATSDLGTSATTSTGSTSATSDTSSTAMSTSAATDTSMMTSTAMSATDTSMTGTMTSGTAMATSTGMMTGTMMSGTAMATSTGMMTGTAMSGTAMSGTAMPMATSTGMMTGTAMSGTAMPMATSTGMMTGTMMSGTATSASGNALLAALSADPQFSQLVSALQLTGLDKQLASAGPVTIFAPTDTAFEALPTATLTALLADPTKLATILSYHVATGRVTAAQVSSATSLPTLEGENITVSASGSTVTLNNSAKVISTEIDTTDGVVHVIDKVLIPPSVKL